MYYEMINGKLQPVSSLTGNKSKSTTTKNSVSKEAAEKAIAGALAVAGDSKVTDALKGKNTFASPAIPAVSCLNTGANVGVAAPAINGLNAGAGVGSVTGAMNAFDAGLIVPVTTSTPSSPGNPVANVSVPQSTSSNNSGFSYGKYNESQAVIDARNAMNAHNANKVAEWTGGTYGQALIDAMDRISNREKFSYDLNGDALYQQYKDKYINQGRLAMMDTIGQASAMTGGYGNSYASTVGNQAYQGYLQQLNDVVPELYQLAYDKYNKEGEDLYNQYAMVNNAYDKEYGQYRDKVADWNTEAERLLNQYFNMSNMDYGRYSDDYSRAFANYQQGVSESQYAQNLAFQKEQFAKNLAMEQAKLNESIRANKANEAAAIQKASYQAQIDALKEQYEGYMSPDIVKASNSQHVKLFNASILTPTELDRRQRTTTVDGKSKRFDNYAQYVNAVLENWYNNGKLTENEVAYLKGQYGI